MFPAEPKSIEVKYVKSNHASFEIDGVLKRSYTVGKLFQRLGFRPAPGDRFSITVQPLLLCLAICFALCVSARADFPRGAQRSPAHKLLNAPAHRVLADPPAQFALIPSQLDMWGNDQFGDCVSAEEAFAKACHQPEIFVSASEVESWAQQHGYLNGADLVSVLTTMQTDGLTSAGQQFNDGPYATVDYSNETVLRSAIATAGPVKIAIDASALPPTAGNQQGWYVLCDGKQYPNTDHCVSICGYGPAEFLYSQLSVSMPPSLAGVSGYYVFTWRTIGFVDHDWLMSTCTEAFVRNPVTVIAPQPTPAPPNPTPPAPPTPHRLTFIELIRALIARLHPHHTPAQTSTVSQFFADDASPRIALLKEIVYQRGVQKGLIPAGTPIGAVNWAELIKIIEELEPIIVPLIPLILGDAHATPDNHPASQSAPARRKQCGPGGCRIVPTEPRGFQFFRRRK